MYSFVEYCKILQEREYERYLEEYPIYLNPTNDELRSLLPNRITSVRGIMDVNGNVFIWNEDIASHFQMSKYIDVPIHVAFYVTFRRGGVKPEADKTMYIYPSWGMGYGIDKDAPAKEALANNKNIQKMLIGFTHNLEIQQAA